MRGEQIAGWCRASTRSSYKDAFSCPTTQRYAPQSQDGRDLEDVKLAWLSDLKFRAKTPAESLVRRESGQPCGALMLIFDPLGIGKRIDPVAVTRDQIKLNPATCWRVGPVVTLKPRIARGQTEVTVSGGNLVLTQVKTLHFEDILQLRSCTSGIDD